MLDPYLILGLMAGYFVLLFFVGQATKGTGDNAAFFSADRSAKWWLVAFGMIGTSLSGVTFISVPGLVSTNGFGYFQVVLGYVIGYTVIALVLLPLYYRLNLVSIYGYLEQRLGRHAFKTGAWFFLLSRSLGSAARFYLVLAVLHTAVFEQLHVPFWLTVIIGLFLIWVYTHQGGVKTIIVTDTLQTAAMLACLWLSLHLIGMALNMHMSTLVHTVLSGPKGQIFNTDWHSPGFWAKQIASGAFIAIVMTGLDQDMMQKNLTVRTLRGAQTNMFAFTAVMVATNFLFLVLGGALWLYAQQTGLHIPAKTDDLFPMIALSELGTAAGLVFLLGIIAATYASTDSALTALTTSFCVDILEMQKSGENDNPGRYRIVDGLRHNVHLGFTAVLFVLVLIFRMAGSSSLLNVVFSLAGYTYGPLLGMFAFGILTKRQARGPAIPWICVTSPILTFIIVQIAPHLTGYTFGFELLLLNGLLCFAGLWAVSKPATLQTSTM